MTKNDTRPPGELQIDFKISPQPTQEAPPEDQPFRIALIGDFSGRASRGEVASVKEIAGRRPVPVDRDNIDDVLARLGVVVAAASGSPRRRPSAARSSRASKTSA